MNIVATSPVKKQDFEAENNCLRKENALLKYQLAWFKRLPGLNACRVLMESGK